ncbi:MAG: GAF domain-containing protein, partial [Acidimicrobiia bacterium]|nr:GAF domain-containing protein [Acidimicrobiia bacterium]
MSQSSVIGSETAPELPINWATVVSSSVGFSPLYQRLASLRGPVSMAAVVLGVAVGVILEWPAAFAVAFLGVLLCLDVIQRNRGVFDSISGTVLVDTTLIAVAIWLLRAPPAVISMPFAYIIATSFLVLAPRKAIVPVAYAVVWMSILLIGNRFWWQQSEGVAGLVVSVAMGGMFIGTLLVMFGSAGKILADVKHSLDRKVRFEEAIAASSRAFATSDDDDPVHLALEALLKATEATAVFVERNVQHPDLGLCSTLIAEVLADGEDADPEDTWTMVPWHEMPVSFASLSAGNAVAFKVADLPDIERARYDGSGVLSELDIPILVRGEWVGLIGFSDVVTNRTWDTREIELLSTAAELVGAYWERIEGREQLEQAVDRLERRHRLEQALAQASSALLASEGSAVEEALDALLVATEADVVFLDENYVDPQLGLATTVTHF